MKQFFLFIAALCCAAMVNAGDYSNYGALQVLNNQLCDKDGNPVQLRGWSTHGSWYQTAYDDATDFQKMKASGANIARIAMYINEGHSYIDYPEDNITWVKNCIDYCAAQNMYCIVDWHALKDREGEGSSSCVPALTDPAVGFFTEISAYVKSKNYHHVLYEILNEPNHNVEGSCYAMGKNIWQYMKSYAASVLPVIKANDPNAIVIVGTPQWDQGLVFPMIDPLDEMGMNVMYSFHSYTGDQERLLGLLSSASAFLPIFVSEWSLLPHGGNCSFDKGKPVADLLMNICNGQNLGGQKISWCNWGWYENSSNVGAAFTNYASSAWSQSGNYVKNLLPNDNFITRTTTDYETQEFDGESGFYLALEKYDLGGPYNAFWDWDEDWLCGVRTSTNGCNGGQAGAWDGVRDDEMVDLGYAADYISLTYIMESEWVQYTINAAYAGDYEFELFTNNHNGENIIAFAVDGQNALVDAEGNVLEQALELQPCHGGSDNEVAYNDWDWSTPKSLLDANKKFRLRLKQGEQKLAIVFMTSSSGLGAIKLRGYEHQSIDQIESSSLQGGDRGRLIFQDNQIFILRGDKTYTLTGQEVR